MNPSNPTPERDEPIDFRASTGATIRAAADGEFEAADADAGSVAFERAMRAAVGRVMSDVPVPAGLADRVRAAMAAADADETPEHSRDETGGVLTPAGPLGGDTTDRSFWSDGLGGVLTGKRSLVAVAAAAVLTAVGVFFVRQGEPAPEAVFASTVRFVTNEHERATSERVAARKFRYTNATEAVREFRVGLGADPMVPEGEVPMVRFVGAGPCAVPGGGGYGGSAHFQYTVEDEGTPLAQADKSGVVSLFIVPDKGQMLSLEGTPIEPGRVHAIDCEALGADNMQLLAWTDGELLHMAVTRVEDAEAATSVLKALQLESLEIDPPAAAGAI